MCLTSLRTKRVGEGEVNLYLWCLSKSEMTLGFSIILTDMATSHPTGHVQLPRADAIRSRLIDTFSLIEHLQGLSQAVPRHTIREIVGPQPVS